ncbi:MAG TPA: thioredoxin domain-containing protein [bacterium]|nr:thioredoxin domain-containing protein [bacterium]
MSPNALAGAASAYLRGAAEQPVAWLPWSEAAFARARAEDKPILLDIGAVWCHWCHVIDHESYDDPAVAAIINGHFVAVKVDRDERPDIDARYQNAVSAITGLGGWPLTAFLTPDGKVFYGGTYFPKDDAHGRPGFRRILLSVAAYYRDNREEAVEAAEQLHRQLAATLASPAAAPGGALGPAHLEAAVASIRRVYDPAEGGFGGAPKFPHTATIELLLRRHARTGDGDLLAMAVRTLEKMARGGIHDQIGGGFHRYSTDGRWIVPHFEKMLYDNAGLLHNYAQAFAATGRAGFAETARDIAAFMSTVLGGERGGFYGSQDADVGPDDDGSYFTWTAEEAAAVLAPAETAVIAEHYHLQGPGEMHGSGRHVLFVDRDPDVIAAVTGRSADEVRTLLASGRMKLAAVRMTRRAPYVDEALYANWNGMAISAFLAASHALGEPSYRVTALRTLERFLAEGYEMGRGFVHVLGGSVPGLADDQVQMAAALLDAYEATGEDRYLRLAREVTDAALRRFWDDPGLRDIEAGTGEAGLDVPYKPVQDAPTPSPNAAGARVLLRLSRLLGADAYRTLAAQLLGAFAPGLAPHGLYASGMFIALDDLLHDPAHVAIVGPRADARTRALHEAALAAWRPDRLISLHEEAGGDGAPIPEVVRAMLAHADEPTAFVCAGSACAPPVRTPEDLVRTLASFRPA